MRVRRYNARNCGIFFFAGVATSLLLDLLGATPLSTVSLFGFGMNFLSFWFVPIVFAIVGVFIGIFSKQSIAKRIGYIDNGEKVKILENDGDWLKVQYTDSKEGYVSAEYVTISEEFIYAKTIEKEQAEIAAQKALQAREQTAEQDAPEVITSITLPATTYTSNAELRQGIIEYAMQYLGNRYVHGGSSLSGGTDCSGFTCFIYAEFGYSIRRTPGGQYSGAGRSISSEELQPGDIVCYSSNGGKSCTHVGLYIGDGQIIHSANSRKGVIISAVDYSPIIGMRNVID